METNKSAHVCTVQTKSRRQKQEDSEAQRRQREIAMSLSGPTLTGSAASLLVDWGTSGT